ncbi:hypothetical protein PuT2_09000 [Pusillimonas sp. T2]|uniref:YeiH family protein n=1 Tax=Pusillimonas sp. T2 TaxID=1548123 RepID=UPI000B8E39F3|nr:YeiH family protein [Pusillimonas sp. T2]OXR49156.1 hypothetical protein PuT2_09000 [Pusillimonas sp. T2]
MFAGLALTAILAISGVGLAQVAWANAMGLSGLTLAIILGMVVGNTVFPHMAKQVSAGVDFSKSTLLKVGIVLFGFKITIQEMIQVGWSGVVIAVVMVGLTFGLALGLGRLLRLDRQTAMLIGAGSAICGAAAVIATESVVKGQAHKVTVAVATVVIFGTLAMFSYPWLYPVLNMTDQAFGVFVGSTVHEVAQVVAVGVAVNEAVASTAVIEKMIRVMFLAPFLMILSAFVACPSAQGRRIVIPWFAALFIVMVGLNSLQILPAEWVAFIVQLDAVFLAMAMAALGLRTRVSFLREAGLRPMLLATALFVFLVVGGYLVNLGVIAWLG